MTLWSRFRSLHWGWQIVVVCVLIFFYPLLFILLPVAAFYALKAKPMAYRLAGVMAALVPIFIFATVTSIKDRDYDDIQRQLDELDSQKHGTELLVQRTATSGDAQPPAPTPAAATQPAKAETAYDRIVAIVERHGEYPTVTNLSDINARNPQPPYEVIVAMTAKSCFSAKDKAHQIIRDLFLDPSVGSALVRVKVIDPHVSVSLGANDAKRVHQTIWSGGPSNFIDALEEVASYDRDMIDGDATSRTAPSYTYAELSYECL